MDQEQGSISMPAVASAVVAIAALLVSLFAAGVGLANRDGTGASGAGPDDGPVAAPAAAQSVSVSLSEYAIAPDVEPIPVGATLEVTNEGAIPHNLQIKNADLQTADLNAGASESLDVSSLAAGDYEWSCTIAGHESAGMTGTFTIAEAAGEPVAAASDGMDHGDGEMQMPTNEDMEAVMEASIGSFPAETEGKGGLRMEPEILPDGTKLFELVVDEVEWEVEPGKVVDALAYNGQIPGPTLVADVGDEVIIRVTNELDHEGTSLHPHGLRDHEFAIDGVTYVSQDPIETGESFDYEFTADEPSVMMYHSHHMSLHQVLNGLAGSMIIGDYAELADIGPVADEQVMVLNDAGSLGFSLNGKSFPATEPYVYQSGDVVLVHYYNEGLMSHPMHLHNQDGLVIAKDGYILDSPYYIDTINVAPGERYTVAYEMEMPGTWLWHCHILSHVKRDDGSMFGMLSAVIVEDPEAA